MSTNLYQDSNHKVEIPFSSVTQNWLKKYVKDIEFNSDGQVSSAVLDNSLEIKLDEFFSPPVASLAIQWAKKYLKNLQINTNTSEKTFKNYDSDCTKVGSKKWRAQTATRLKESLISASIEASYYAELLLSQEIKRHQIDPKLIDIWQIAADSCEIHRQVLEVYGNAEHPSYLAVAVGEEIGAMRQKYTAIDPRVIGFVSIQVYYTTRFLLKDTSPVEQTVLTAYFKVIDDYLYMPLHRCYEAAARHHYNSPSLQTVRQLLGKSSEIAASVFSQVSRLNPDYCSYSGLLNSAFVKAASIRDVEMFQVYLWLCVLEENMAIIHQELFPISVMLYPMLGVKWELIWQMLTCLKKELLSRLETSQLEIIMPYLRAMCEMFSSEVFTEDFSEIEKVSFA